MDDLRDQIRAWTDAVGGDGEPVTAAEARARAVRVRATGPVDRPTRRLVLVGAAAALVLVALVVAVAGVDSGQDVTTGGPGVSDGGPTDVGFVVLTTAPGTEAPGTMRSTYGLEGLDSLWVAAGLDVPAPPTDGPASSPIDFATQMVVSMSLLDGGCGAVLQGFDRDGSDLTPVFRTDDGCPATLVVALDRAAPGESLRLLLPPALHGGLADRILDLAPPLATSGERPVVWPTQETTADRSSPEAAARSFITHLLGAEGPAAAVEAMSETAPVPVEVGIGTTAVTLQTDLVDGGWAVGSIRGPAIDIVDGTTARIGPGPGASLAEVWVETDLGVTATLMTTDGSSDRLIALPPGTVRSIVVVDRDDDATIVGIGGQGF